MRENLFSLCVNEAAMRTWWKILLGDNRDGGVVILRAVQVVFSWSLDFN